MFNVGGPEFLVIVLVALVVLGPQQLPKAMRTFGSVMAEVRKVSNTFQAEMRNAMDTVVDASATEKPQSAKMAAAKTPAESADSDAGASDADLEPDVTEVVARNDGDGADDSDGASTSEPPVSPADRAAG